MRKGLLICVLIVFAACFHSGAQQHSDHRYEAKLAMLKAKYRQINTLQSRYAFADSLFKANAESDLNTAAWFAERLYTLSDSVGTPQARILGNHAMSLCLAYLGDYSGSIPFCERELELGIENRDSLTMARAYLNLGDNYLEIGRMNLAYYFTQKCLEIARASNSLIDVEFATHNTARIHKELGQYDLAMRLFQSADSMSIQLQDLQAPMYSWWELGDLYRKKGDYARADDHLRRALQLAKKLDVAILKPDIYIDLGKLAMAQEDLTAATAFYDSAHVSGEQLGNRLVEAECLLGFGTLKMKQKDWQAAERLLLQSVDIARKLHAKKVEIECYAKLSECSERQGQFELALDRYRRYDMLKDSLVKFDVADQTLKYQMEFLQEATNRELANHREQLDRSHFYRNLMIAGMVVLALLLYLLFRAVQRRNQVNALLSLQRQELEERSRELEELSRLKDKFLSIISHDLRSPINTLAGVLNLMEKNGVSPEELPMLTRELRIQFNHTKNLITNLLNWALLQMDRVSIRKELLLLFPVVEENFKLVRSITGKQINLVNSVPTDIRVFADLNSLDLVLRNLIQNAVKFTDPGGTVMVAATEEASQIIIRVQDNGIGIEPEIQRMLLSGQSGYTSLGTANEKGTGLGLGLCKEFVERNGGQIWLTSQRDVGTTFYFSFPKQTAATGERK